MCLQERITGLQRAIAQIDAEKKESQRGASMLEKDKNALQNTLDKVCWTSNFFEKRCISYCM